MFDEKFWEDGLPIASFTTNTSGPERHWDIFMRLCLENGKQYIVLTDPFADRFIWFDNDPPGKLEARRAFEHLTGLVLLDSDAREANDETNGRKDGCDK